MKCAIEMAKAINEKIEAERLERERRRQEQIAEYMKEFFASLEEIDKYVEEKLLENNGSVELLIDCEYWRGKENFYFFAKKTYCDGTLPYWGNAPLTPSFHLDTYCEYLKNLCYNVELVKRPFKAQSSTGKTTREMPGLTLKISIAPECVKA